MATRDLVQDISKRSLTMNPQVLDDAASARPIAAAEEIASRKGEGTEQQSEGVQRPEDRQLGPQGGLRGQADNAVEEPGQPKWKTRRGKRHATEKDLKLKQTRKDDARDGRPKLQVPASVQRRMEGREK